ncbi:MAG: hypothetical protein JSS98_12975 [Bacteroidetes bacterium]|nr:hypothetical protein [Bacteroidota bacterium]
MKRMIFLVGLLIFSHQLFAQTFDEWFHQKKTQIKYLLQQIAANEVYIEYLQKGYKIAESGLNTINEIKHGDFNLHSDFFNSLKTVNPKIKNWAKVPDIVSLQLQIIKQAKSAVHHIRASDQFTSTEITYLQNVFNHLLDECIKEINALTEVTTSGKTEMTDDERIKKIDSIYNDMQDKLSFSKSFSFDAAMLAMQRMQEATDVEVSRKLIGSQ